MNWLKKLLGKKSVAKEDTLEQNDNVFRTKRVKQLLSQKNYILCNGKEVLIEWDQVVRFDKGGPGYESANYKKRSKRHPRMFAVHWDACINTQQMIDVTKERGLSVHFGIDNDGTIYQLLDTKDIAWHARGINTHSVGVEIANPVKAKFNKRYKEKQQPLRPVINDDEIHGRKLKPYLGFYPIQVEALKALTKAVCTAHNIHLEAPLNKDGSLVRGVEKRVVNGTFKGVLGHYHLTSEKTDPGNLPLDKILQEIKCS